MHHPMMLHKEKDTSYEQLLAKLESMPRNEVMIVMKDKNATVGNDNTSYYGYV